MLAKRTAHNHTVNLEWPPGGWLYIVCVRRSLESLDMAEVVDGNGSFLRILAEGRNYHANVGSSGGQLYMWEVETNFRNYTAF